MTEQRRDIREYLADLIRQATEEKSHYYTASVLREADAEIARLREALAPFATFAAEWDGHEEYIGPDGDEVVIDQRRELILTIGDFRRARAAHTAGNRSTTTGEVR